MSSSASSTLFGALLDVASANNNTTEPLDKPDDDIRSLPQLIFIILIASALACGALGCAAVFLKRCQEYLKDRRPSPLDGAAGRYGALDDGVSVNVL